MFDINSKLLKAVYTKELDKKQSIEMLKIIHFRHDHTNYDKLLKQELNSLYHEDIFKTKEKVRGIIQSQLKPLLNNINNKEK